MELDIAGSSVEELDTEHAVTLFLTGGVQVRIESSFSHFEPGHPPTLIDPEDLGTDQRLQQSLEGRTILSAIADCDTGTLLITFEGGSCVQVPSDPDFESWSANWPDGTTVVAIPGGGLTKWPAKP